MSDKWILTVVHQATSIHGKMGDALASRGYLLDRRCPYEGEGLPSSLEGYDGVVVFGGPQSANDDHEVDELNNLASSSLLMQIANQPDQDISTRCISSTDVSPRRTLRRTVP